MAKIDCLMGTYGRYSLACEAVACFLQQTALSEATLLIYNQHPVPLHFDHPRVRVVNETPPARSLRHIRHRMHELAEPSAEFIHWWDDDDLYLPWHLEDCLTHIGDHVAWKPASSWISHGNVGYSPFRARCEGSWVFRADYVRIARVEGHPGYTDHPMICELEKTKLVATTELAGGKSYIYRWGCAQHLSAYAEPSDDEAQARIVEHWRRGSDDVRADGRLVPADLTLRWRQYLDGTRALVTAEEWESNRSRLPLNRIRGAAAADLTAAVRVSDAAGPRRAIVCFVEDDIHRIQQALALRQSWLYVDSPDTDLVMMGPPNVLARVPDDVVKIEQRVVAGDPEWFSYEFANSIACMNGAGAHRLDRYSHILRTDVDTFITPAWNTFQPMDFICGRGGYSNDDHIRQKLRDIAAEFGLQHRGLTNTGSTWYGPTPLIRRIAAVTEMILRYILDRYFREDKGAWPGWYEGVALLYASEIAINHCAPEATRTDQLDHGTTLPLPASYYAHLLCWHTDEKFSKHWFVSRRYTERDRENLNLDIIPDYALEMSFRSLRDLEAYAARVMSDSNP